MEESIPSCMQNSPGAGRKLGLASSEEMMKWPWGRHGAWCESMLMRRLGCAGLDEGLDFIPYVQWEPLGFYTTCHALAHWLVCG